MPLISFALRKLDCTRPRCYDSPLMTRSAARFSTGMAARAAIAAAVLFSLAGCGSLVLATADTPACVTPGPALRADSFKTSVALTTAKDGLKYGDIRVGCGAQPHAGQTVTLQYTGWLANGRFFDSSRAGGRPPLSFRLGEGVIIRGLEEGVATMHLGGTRRLVIPPSLAFGPTARGSVPPNSTIVINIELVAIS